MIIFVRLYAAGGVIATPDVAISVPDHIVLGGFELSMGVPGGWAPIVAQSFTIHEDSAPRYHTVCSRRDDTISEVAW